MIVILIVIAFLCDRFGDIGFLKAVRNWWQGGWDIYPGVATLLVALVVWFGEAKEDWLNELPKKLSVTFKHAGKDVMRCRYADLANAADMRALAQQIGLQMTKETRLNFVAPLIKQDGGEVEKTDEGHIRHYHLHVALTEMPASLTGKITEGESVLVWEPPFEDLKVESA
ncbi:MAG: hypothetical protein A2286_03455 [Gammaproteobacteria bacterium RIFOXYA12_FULL_61_12]|nr:MAG: hypothetical protein A2286_03455 [Gammaproteobacteria bacterium RIFOXYA12_FULL_61_12]